MTIPFDIDDDIDAIDAVIALARQIRRARNPRRAVTAAKIEIALMQARAAIDPQTTTPQQQEAA